MLLNKKIKILMQSTGTTLTPQVISQCSATLRAPNSTKQQIQAILCIIQQKLWMDDQSDQFNLLMDSNLLVELFNYTLTGLRTIQNYETVTQEQANFIQLFLRIFNRWYDKTEDPEMFIKLGLYQLWDYTLQFKKYLLVISNSFALIAKSMGQVPPVLKMMLLKQQRIKFCYLSYADFIWNSDKYINDSQLYYLQSSMTSALNSLFYGAHQFGVSQNQIKPTILFYLDVLYKIRVSTSNPQVVQNIYECLSSMAQAWNIGYDIIHKIVYDRFSTASQEQKYMIIDIYWQMGQRSQQALKVLSSSKPMITFIILAMRNNDPAKRQMSEMCSGILKNLLMGSDENVQEFVWQHPNVFYSIMHVVQKTTNVSVVNDMVEVFHFLICTCNSLEVFHCYNDDLLFMSFTHKLRQLNVNNQLDDEHTTLYVLAIVQYVDFLNHQTHAPEITFSQMMKTIKSMDIALQCLRLVIKDE